MIRNIALSILIFLTCAYAQRYKDIIQDDIFNFDFLSLIFGDFHINGQFSLKGAIDKGAIDIDFLYHPKASYSSYLNGIKYDWEKKYIKFNFGFNYFFGTAPYGIYIGPYIGYFSESFTGPTTPPSTNATLSYGTYERKNTILGLQAGFNYIFENNIVFSIKATYPLLVFGDDPIAQPPEEYVKSPKGYIYLGYKF